MELYKNISFDISKKITTAYSTSFTLGIKLFAPRYREPIYAIYGFVRSADEIVDTFHEHDKHELLKEFREDTHKAIKRKVSTNPILHSFQYVVNKFSIPLELIDAFLSSMEMDLYNSSFQRKVYDQYIYGSAEVVGLMCLKVFCDGDSEKYNKLVEPARLLGAAFQKVNFLRDIKSDIDERGRIYLPDVHKTEKISDENKKLLETEIEKEFAGAYKGILELPAGVKLGVYTAFLFYTRLFCKIKELNTHELKAKRVRISNLKKTVLLIKSIIKIKLLRLI